MVTVVFKLLEPSDIYEFLILRSEGTFINVKSEFY